VYFYSEQYAPQSMNSLKLILTRILKNRIELILTGNNIINTHLAP